VTSLEDIKKYYKSIFLLDDEDDCILDAMAAIAISVHTDSDPIWLMVLGAPSSGKSELVTSLNDVYKSFPVSTITENTFLSGMRSSDGKELSLLRQIGKQGLLIMKDYTTILSMHRDKRDTIIAQFREIYDGEFTKRTGNGVGGQWKGKVNLIAGVTDALFTSEGEAAEMGRRALNYILPEMSDNVRKDMSRRSVKNINNIGEMRQKIRTMFKDFVAEKIAELPAEGLPPVEEEFSESIIDLSNFLTKARTATKRDFQGKLIQVMWHEAPMRANNQLHMMAQMFQWFNEGNATDKHKRCVYKIALDSIPKLRRMTLEVLTKFDAVTTKGFAQHLGYPSKTAREWLEDMNVLGICERSANSLGFGIGVNIDVWTIKEPYREIMLKYSPHIKRVNDTLKGDETSDSDDDSGGKYNGDPGMAVEEEANAEKDFEELTGLLDKKDPDLGF